MAIGVVVLVLWRLLDGAARTPGRLPSWPGAIHPTNGVQQVTDGEAGYADATDAGVPFIDIERLRATMPAHFGQAHWSFDLAEAPPRAATLDPAATVITYGLVLDTTGDGVADIVVGINNDAPRQGDFRVWVSDLAAGKTETQVGPPYGYPVEFSHPEEPLPDGSIRPHMHFTFLAGSHPPGLSRSTSFYAWSSLTRDGVVTAWDYAPDAGWLVVVGG